MRTWLLKLTLALLCVFASIYSHEENFILWDVRTSEYVLKIGDRTQERMSPCSTFKIALSLMGFDSGILKDETSPVWLYQEGYDDFLESWKNPQNPQSWMKNSCVWYSRVLASNLGMENLQNYLAVIAYGNQDLSGGLTRAWLSSSLKISPQEQVEFIEKMLREELAISKYAIQMTKKILYIEKWHGWNLFGKAGWGSSKNSDELGWFVGWIEKDGRCFAFAYTICDTKIDLSQRIPRVKHLLIKSKAIDCEDQHD